MSDADIVAVKPEIAAHALLTRAQYDDMTRRAADTPDAFWAEESKRITWIKAPTKIKNASFSGDVSIKWFEDGTLNAAANCLDRHLAERGDQVAIIWESDDPDVSRKVTYRELHEQVCRLANALTAQGVKKGDVVTIYLPMVVEGAVALLACARIGAIHSVVFGGFSPNSLANRIQDCNSVALITADEGRRGGRKVALKANADEALKTCPTIKNVIVVKVTGGDVAMQPGRDVWYEAVTASRLARACGGGNAGRGPALHPLYLRFHGQAQGRAAHHRRLSRLGELHASIRVRLPSGRGLLVHRRYRMGYRAHLYRLRAAREWCDDADVRGHAELP